MEGVLDACLVTGATGFIGSYLVRELRRRGTPVATPRLDVRDPSGWEEVLSGVDTVFHLAGKAHALAPTAADLAEYASVNVEGTRNVLAASAAAGVKRFIFASSVKATGDTPYGESKRRAEQLVLDFPGHAVCLRLSLVYGPGNKGNLYSMLRGIDRGYFPPIRELGNRRSMVHVSNVVDAMLLAARNPAAAGKRYVVADAAPYSTRELYEAICGALGKPVPRWNAPLPALKLAARMGDVIGRARGRRFFFDSDALEKLVGTEVYDAGEIARELGFKPQLTLRDAMPAMVAAYREIRP